MTSVANGLLSWSFNANTGSARDMVSAASLDAQFQNLWFKFAELNTAVSVVIRSDNTLVDECVRVRNLHPETVALIETAVTGSQGPQGPPGPAVTDASTLTSGTIADARLSANVPLLNAASNTFSGGVSFSALDLTNGIQYLQGGIASGVCYLQTNPGPLVVRTIGFSNLKLGTNSTDAITIDTSQNVGIGVTPTAGNGLIQLANGTAKASGIAFGTDTFLYRTNAGQLFFENSTSARSLNISIDGGGAYFRSSGAYPLILGTNNTTALTIDTSQNCTFAGSINGNGSGITALNASNLSTGTVPVARLPLVGAASAGVAPASGGGAVNYLRADGTWAAPTLSGGASLSAANTWTGANTFAVFSVKNAAFTTVADSFSIAQTTGFAGLISTGVDASTVGQFLIRCERGDGTSQRTLLSYDGASTTLGESVILGKALSVRVRSVVSAGATTVLDASDHFCVLTGSANQTFILPAASNGRVLRLKNSSTGTLTANRAGSDTIDGGTTTTVASSSFKTLIANGTDWCIAG